MPSSQSANVHTVDAIKDVRAAMIVFLERATNAMGELRQKVDRTAAWIEQDRPNYWREQERKAYDQIAATRVAYETCRLRTVAGHRSECIDEKKAFERAKLRMEFVRQKQAVLKKWLVETARESNEYRARTSNFLRMLDNEVPLMIAQLGRMIDAIEAYSEVKTSIGEGPQMVSSAGEPVANDAAQVGSPESAPTEPTDEESATLASDHSPP